MERLRARPDFVYSKLNPRRGTMPFTLGCQSTLENEKLKHRRCAHNSAQGGAQRNPGNEVNLTFSNPGGVELALAKDIARVIFHSMLLQQRDVFLLK